MPGTFHTPPHESEQDWFDPDRVRPWRRLVWVGAAWPLLLAALVLAGLAFAAFG